MNVLKENLLAQFLVVGLAAILGVAAINAALFFTLEALVATAPWTAYAFLGGSLVVVLGILAVPVWRGWNAATSAQARLAAANDSLQVSLEARGSELQETRDQLSFEINEREDLEERLRETMEEINVVDEVAQAISATRSVNEVYTSFALKVRQLVDFDRLEVCIVDHRASTYTTEYFSGVQVPGYALGSVNPLEGTVLQQITVTGKSLCRPDLLEESQYPADSAYLKLDLRTSIQTPLVSKGQVIGVVGLYHHQPGSYGGPQQGMLERVSHQLAATVDNVRLHGQLEASTEEIAVVDELARIITSALNTEEVYEKFALEMKKLVDFDRAHITVVDRSADNFTLKYLYGPPLPGRPVGSVRPLEGTLTGKVVATAKTINRPDITGDQAYPMDPYYVRQGLKSCIMVPLISKGRVIGSMGLGSQKLRAYTPRDREVLEQLAHQIAPAVENAQLDSQIQTARQETEVVDQITSTITGSEGWDIDQAYGEFARQIRKLVSFDRISIDIINEKSETFEARYLFGEEVPEHYVGAVRPLEGSDTGEVYLTQQTLVREDLATDLRFPTDQDFLKQGFHSSIALPLICSNRVIGTLGARSHRVGAYGPREKAILERLARHISPAVEGAKLFQQLKSNTEAMAALDEVARIITSTESFEEVCERFARETQKLVRFDRLAINVVDRESSNYTLEYLFGQARPGQPVGSVRPLADSESGDVVEAGHTLVRPDIAREPRYSTDQEYLKLGFHSSIAVPLASRGQVIGVLVLHSRQLGSYGPQDREILEHLAHQIAHAVENIRLYQQIEASNEETAVVDQIARIITSTLDIEEVYEKFCLEMTRLVNFDQLSVNIIDNESGVYETKYLFGQEIPEHYMGEIRPLAGSLTGQVMHTSRTLVRGDVAHDPGFPEDPEYLRMGLHSSIVVPLISTGRVIGALSFRCYRVGAYGPREQNILERLAYQIAHAVENSWLYEATRTEKERATTALAQLQALLDGVDSGICLTGSDYRVLWVNHAFCDYFGVPETDAISVGGTQYINHEMLRQMWRPCFSEPDRVFGEWDRIYADNEYRAYTGELEFIYPQKRILEEFTAPVYSDSKEYVGRLWVYKDVTGRKQSEEQILQSQKIESVGRLAGGVAHDFNNLLMVIMGYSQLLSRELAPRSNASNHLHEIQKAGERAANLTKQLLAFSRRQVIEPKVVNLNSLILNLDRMLRRLIGEDIELVTLPAPDLEPVKVDPGQMEQVLMNLAINARDAMPDGGKLVIETASIALDAEQVRGHSEATPGEYVLLSVTDTGAGMSEDIRNHLFEPFFTTKGVGEGTGLGLATCYGIIKQSGGYIEVDSQLERGTQFNIYLPRSAESLELVSPNLPPEDLYLGTETVLLAEDEPSVRAMVATVLREQGYKVLEAANGDEALHLVQKHGGEKIDLLVTDVVMPKISGPELAQRLHATRPNLKVLFTSGYAEGAVNQRSALDSETDFLQKPYQPDVLAVKVREVLDREEKTPRLLGHSG